MPPSQFISLLLLSLGGLSRLHHVHAQTALASACPAVNNEVPFYLDPSVLSPGNENVINPAIGSCTACGEPKSVYFASATTQALFNGGFIADYPLEVYTASTIGGVPNGIALILDCPNACVCNANGLCAQVVTPMTNFALYPYCTTPTSCQMYFYVVSTQFLIVGMAVATILYSDGTTANFATLTSTFTPVPVAGTIPITSASCTGCTYAIATNAACTTATAAPTPSVVPPTCFTGDSMVRLHNGQLKRMDELVIGEWILALEGTRLVSSPVESWIHRNPARVATFLRVELDSGRVLKLTENHYVYRKKGGNAVDSPKPPEPHVLESFKSILAQSLVEAAQLRVGDYLYEMVEQRGNDDGRLGLVEREVISVSRVSEKGVYSPMTAEGNLFVNDVLVSCMSNLDEPLLQRNFLKVQRSGALVKFLNCSKIP